MPKTVNQIEKIRRRGARLRSLCVVAIGLTGVLAPACGPEPGTNHGSDSEPTEVADALTSTLNPIADTYVKDGSPDTPFGSTTPLEVKKGTSGLNREAYLRFDLTPFSGTVRNAKLRLFGSASSTDSVKVIARLLRDNSFVESTVTYNMRPPLPSIELGRVSVSGSTGMYYEFDVTGVVRQRKRAGASTIDFALNSFVTSNSVARFDSRESSSSKPELVINSSSALFVVGSTTLGTGDAAVSARLSSLGFSVTTKAAASTTSADASGQSLVVVSSSVASADVNTKFRDVAVPVVTWENGIYDDMKMTGTVSGTDFGTTSSQTAVSIVTDTHALAGGRQGASVAVAPSGTLTWGKPGTAAAKIASLPSDGTKLTLFGYDKGTAMVGMNAPERRVGLFLADTTAASLQRNGWLLFDAAVNWASYSKAFASKKVLLVVYDPIIEASQSRRLHDVLGFPSPSQLAQQAVTEFALSSGDYVRYQIVQTKTLDEWPVRDDGSRYADDTYLADYMTGNFNSSPTSVAGIVSSQSLTAGINAGTYDEVWVSTARGILPAESVMIGKNPIDVNHGPLVDANANRRYIIEGLDFTGDIGQFQHGYVHRVESFMFHVYAKKYGDDGGFAGGMHNWGTSPGSDSCFWTNPPVSPCRVKRTHNWDNFTLVDGIATDLKARGDTGAVAGVGAAHYVANAQVQSGSNADEYNYNYHFLPSVSSTADDWMYNFPNLTGEKRLVAPTEWVTSLTAENQSGFMLWFNNHLPRVPGRHPNVADRVLFNWWDYVLNFEDYSETLP